MALQTSGRSAGRLGATGSAADLRRLAETTFAGAAVEAFERELHCVRAARHFVSAALGPEAAMHDVALLVASELCANAVLHARTPFVVVVSRGIGRARISVGDLSPAKPVPMPSSMSSQTGRGLLLVDAMSSAWGCEPWASGKVVWAELGPV